MDFPDFAAVIATFAFAGLLIAGRRDIARGANAEVASGAVLLALATVLGTITFGLWLLGNV